MPFAKMVVVSDGTSSGTHIFDDTGREMRGGIKRISWSIEPGKEDFGKLEISLEGPLHFTVTGEAELAEENMPDRNVAA